MGVPENLSRLDEAESFEDAQPFFQLLATILNRLTREPATEKDDTLEDNDSQSVGRNDLEAPFSKKG